MDTKINFTMEEIIPIVEKLSRKYTNNESTSITYETAQALMEAVIYCINEEGEGLQLNFISAQEAYDTGYKAVIEKTENALKIYEKTMENFNDYGSRAYHETISLGMPAFFKYYDPLFEPQNHILSLDYPLEEHLQIEVWKKKGIDRIYDYLLAIAEEQKFLANYPEESIRDRLKKYHFLGGELFINVKEVFAGGN